MRKVVLILGTFFVVYTCKAQDFDCSKFKTGLYKVNSESDGITFEYLISRSESTQWELLINCSIELPNYFSDTLFFHVNWYPNQCQYSLIMDTVLTNKKLVTELKGDIDSMLVDITAMENNCFYYRVKTLPNEGITKSKMCRLLKPTYFKKEDDY